MRNSLCLVAFLALYAVSIVSVSTPVMAQNQNEDVISRGKDDFYWSCLPCHGEKGRGDGVMSSILKKPPADLTQIAKNNGGKFPFWTIFNVVAGRETVPGHETLQMPNYWERYWGEQAEKGFLPPDIRILLLTHFVESIQEK